MCRKQSGQSIGRLCVRCDGRCVICDSFVHAAVAVRICDECHYGRLSGRCIQCGAVAVSDAYYCRQCVLTGKDRDGCPRVINLGSSKTDLAFDKKRVGNADKTSAAM